MAIEATNEFNIRTAIVTLIENTVGAGKVYDHFRKPDSGLLADLNVLTVDDANKINVVFVRWVALTPLVSSFDDPISSTETYEIWFYRGVIDATDGTDSESQLVRFIHLVQQAFTDNKDLDATPIGPFLFSQGGMSTASPLIDTQEVNGYDCHRFIGRLTVSIEDC